LIAEVNQQLLIKEIDSISPDYRLFYHEDYSCFFAPKKVIPNIFKEISRLRELTFRQIGEGTGNEHDQDKYDEYYKHLFLWDNTHQQIVGAYRIGLGEEIITNKSTQNFYINSLFTFKKEFETYMASSMELGRSFIIPSYQRKTLPLYLLWKGINHICINNPSYKYLIGPVSISNMYSQNAKILMLEFLKRLNTKQSLSQFVFAKTPFKYRLNRHHRALLKFVDKDLQKLDKVIRCIDKNKFATPVLIKKYLSLGGEIISFNVDPEFNYSIDGLVVLEIEKVSDEIKNNYK
jgi:putative hemolysin